MNFIDDIKIKICICVYEFDGSQKDLYDDIIYHASLIKQKNQQKVTHIKTTQQLYDTRLKFIENRLMRKGMFVQVNNDRLYAGTIKH